jgi:hypothetical protein
LENIRRDDETKGDEKVTEITEKCKIKGCNAPCESSTGLCHEHEIEERMKESDDEYEREMEEEKELHRYEIEGDDEDEE